MIAVDTNILVYSPPTPLSEAILQVKSWMESPSSVLINEAGETYFRYLEHLLEISKVSGPRIHDARIAAVCLSHGVEELWSADRDFSRFPDLNVVNPIHNVDHNS